MFPLLLFAVLVLLVLGQAVVTRFADKVGGSGRSMTGYPFDPFDPQRLR